MSAENLPHHVGVIMDGNGRWAEKKGLPRNAGHKVGAQVIEMITTHAMNSGVKHITFYAFSTENFLRPKEEVDGIVRLMRSYLKKQKKRQNKDVRMRFIGNVSELPDDMVEDIRLLEEGTKENTKMNANIAFNYGGRQEILRAAKTLAAKHKAGEIEDLSSFEEENFADLLYTNGQPDVDLLIRTSGEMRISNFLLWQCAYAEFSFPKVLWPDFSTKDFDSELVEYAGRNRRLGGVK